MTQKVTIGGNRLGSGKKMTADLKTFERSTHNLSKIWRSTMTFGTLTPFLKELALPGDTFDINLDCDIKTHPTVGPLFGSAKVQLDIFQCPIRLYQGQLHNNKLGIGMNMANVKLPILEMVGNNPLYTEIQTTDIDNCQINPSSIFSYLDIRGIGVADEESPTVIRTFNAVPYLAYWDIYKNYYANKQEEIGAVIHKEPQAVIKTIQTVKLYRTYTSPSGTQVTAEDTIPETTEIFGGYSSYGTDFQYIQITFTGTRPITEQILITTEVGQIPIHEMFDIETESSSTITEYARIKNKYMNIKICGWSYITPTSLILTEPTVHTFPLSNIDEMREDILAATKNTAPFSINQLSPEPYNLPLLRAGETAADYTYSKLYSLEGLALKTYQSDLFNNWMSTEWIDGDNGISAITAINTEDGEFTLDTLNLAQKVYNMLNRIAISGGSYNDWLDAVYTHTRFREIESPVYHGGLIKELTFQEVISQAEAQLVEGQQPLGTLAGRGVMSNKHKGGKITIKIDEPSYIIGIISVTPRVDYSQGNKWDVNLKTMDDLHKPNMDEIGFQDLITDQMAWWDTNLGTGTEEPIYKSAGKQPAWINYMTNVNEIRGNFAVENNEMFMVFNRKYERDETTNEIKDLTTYIDPTKFNHIFAQTSRDAQNLWTQIGVDMIVRRKMSARIMPNL